MSGRLVIRPALPGEPALWAFDPKGRAQPTDADELGLDDALADRIEEWLDEIDASLDESGEMRSLSVSAREAIANEGALIAALVRDDLGEDWDVTLDLANLGSAA
jgi:hypothetical protein